MSQKRGKGRRKIKKERRAEGKGVNGQGEWVKMMQVVWGT
jgi:hypothetical protein